ncbi:MFS transporter [Aeromicrobium sp. SMF47]|uniref:MFS transporter n=1 Tax=Aeromicrobium yanjiei TaxID=2662028 RepID=A0A5Q2MHE7_9ACTN|nr:MULTISPECIES: MFS transporter [Aeromicrobium]MRJ77702.1 MFS transporter [Aeromicrobium yanjiei]MRK02071.1 MFS transporter [Aeromicrobium sp. S22]QGG41199.1 MFS transporter [Aeromicrobium yanjiei]
MLTTYRDVLSRPGAALFSFTALWSRLPLSMAGLGIVLLVHERGGSYKDAGIMSAAYVLAAAAFGPLQGRLADRVGQATVLWVVGGLYATGIGAFLYAVDQDWSTPWPHACAVLAGLATPQTGSMVRARWNHVITDRTQLNTAFSIEAIADEVVFIVGPVLVTFLTLQAPDVTGLICAAAAALIGSWALALQRSTQPPATPRDTHVGPALNWAFLGPIVLVSGALGIVFGSAEVIIAAFTDEQGRPGAAGFVLAVWAAGSLLAGVAVGALPQPARPLVRLRRAILVLGALFAPLYFVTSIPAVAIGVFLGGFMISPTLIAMVNLIEREVPHTRLTEALTWSTTGMSVGVAPGAAVAGAVIDGQGASAGFLVPLAAGVAGAVVAWSIRTSTQP